MFKQSVLLIAVILTLTSTGALLASPALATASSIQTTPAVAAASCGGSNWNGVVVTSATPHDTYFCNPAIVDIYGSTIEQLSTKVPNRYWLKEQGGGWSDCYEYSLGTHKWNISGRDAGAGEVQMSSNTAPC